MMYFVLAVTRLIQSKLAVTVSDLRLLLMQKTQLEKTKLENNKT